MSAAQKKVVYIAGPITGEPAHLDAFKEAEADLTALGFVALSQAQLPEGLDDKQYARICMAMMDSADVILLLDGWGVTDETIMAKCYARYCKVPHVHARASLLDEVLDPKVRQAWLNLELEEVLGR